MLSLAITYSSGLPEPPDAGLATEVWRSRQGVTSAWAYSRDGHRWLLCPGVAAFRFGEPSNEVTALAHPDATVETIHDAFRRSVLPIALQALGREALHASAVDTRQGVVAFCAEAETGKSTIAYGLSRLGFEQWSDDVIVFERFAGMLRVLPLPFRPRLRPASRRLFGAAKTESDGVRAAGSARRLAALCVLKRSDHVWAGDGQMIRLAPSRAFSALLGHAVCFDPHDTPRIRQTLERYLDLASTTPVFELQFRHDIDAVPALLARIVTTIEGLGVE